MMVRSVASGLVKYCTRPRAICTVDNTRHMNGLDELYPSTPYLARVDRTSSVVRKKSVPHRLDTVVQGLFTTAVYSVEELYLAVCLGRQPGQVPHSSIASGSVRRRTLATQAGRRGSFRTSECKVARTRPSKPLRQKAV